MFSTSFQTETKREKFSNIKYIENIFTVTLRTWIVWFVCFVCQNSKRRNLTILREINLFLRINTFKQLWIKNVHQKFRSYNQIEILTEDLIGFPLFSSRAKSVFVFYQTRAAKQCLCWWHTRKVIYKHLSTNSALPHQMFSFLWNEVTYPSFCSLNTVEVVKVIYNFILSSLQCQFQAKFLSCTG